MSYYITPYRRLNALRHAMDRMFEDTLSETTAPEREMLLAVDVQGSDDAYTITALLPGLNAEELDIVE
jgi:HSP20 family molecular chaperone IbpA